LSSIDELRKIYLRNGQAVVDAAIHDFLNNKGVSCFSERNDSLLMWGHYGGRFSGFCLEFRTDLDLFQKARRVIYTESMPEVDIVPLLCDEEDDQILDLYCTKAADWHYEHEWRCLHKEAGTLYHYPAESLSGIYIGPDAPFSNLEIIALILGGQNQETQLWQGRRSKTSFSVEFEPIKYIPHIEAKRADRFQRSEQGESDR
jgi:hypothetical protein